MTSRELQQMMRLCRAVQGYGRPMPAKTWRAPQVALAMRAGLVVSDVVAFGRGEETVLVTTEAGYEMSRAVCLYDAERALELPALLGLV